MVVRRHEGSEPAAKTQEHVRSASCRARWPDPRATYARDRDLSERTLVEVPITHGLSSSYPSCIVECEHLCEQACKLGSLAVTEKGDRPADRVSGRRDRANRGTLRLHSQGESVFDNAG